MEKEYAKYVMLLCTLFVSSFASGCLPDGAALFEEKGCSTCHRFRGGGGSLGPDLTAVAARRPRSWIRRQITDPAAHDPGARMPAYNALSFLEQRALVNYLVRRGD